MWLEGGCDGVARVYAEVYISNQAVLDTRLLLPCSHATHTRCRIARMCAQHAHARVSPLLQLSFPLFFLLLFSSGWLTQARKLDDHREVASYGIKNSFHPETSSTVTLRVDEAAPVPEQHDPDYIAASQVVAGAAATGWRCRVKYASRLSLSLLSVSLSVSFFFPSFCHSLLSLTLFHFFGSLFSLSLISLSSFLSSFSLSLLSQHSDRLSRSPPFHLACWVRCRVVIL